MSFSLQELVNTAESLVNGNLAILDDGGLEEYQQTVEQASCISDLVSLKIWFYQPKVACNKIFWGCHTMQFVARNVAKVIELDSTCVTFAGSVA